MGGLLLLEDKCLHFSSDGRGRTTKTSSAAIKNASVCVSVWRQMDWFYWEQQERETGMIGLVAVGQTGRPTGGTAGGRRKRRIATFDSVSTRFSRLSSSAISRRVRLERVVGLSHHWTDCPTCSITAKISNETPGRLSTLVHVRPCSSTLVHIRPRSSTFIHIRPRLSTSVHVHPHLSTFVHVCPRPSMFRHFPPSGSSGCSFPSVRSWRCSASNQLDLSLSPKLHNPGFSPVESPMVEEEQRTRGQAGRSC